MARRILFTASAREGRGSWEIRGRQIADAMGATAELDASAYVIAKADIVVIVKVASVELLKRVRKRGCPWVLDILDAWPQPAGNQWDRKTATAWLRDHVGQCAPAAAICTTEAMRRDLGGVVPAVTIYHHARPSQPQNGIAETVRRVGYEGSERYLSGWRNLIEAECRKRKWKFVVNPPALYWLDIALAVRGGPWAGYTTEQWKSNVKLANAQGTGTPIICGEEAGYIETASGGEFWVKAPADLSAAFNALEGREERSRRAKMLKAREFDRYAAAEQYMAWLDTIG